MPQLTLTEEELSALDDAIGTHLRCHWYDTDKMNHIRQKLREAEKAIKEPNNVETSVDTHD